MQTSRMLLVAIATAVVTAGLVWLLTSRNPAAQLAVQEDPLSDIPADLEPEPPPMEISRYQMHMIPVLQGDRTHFLLDSATGQVWVPRIRGGPGTIVGWIKAEVRDLPKIEVPEIGRFTANGSATYGADQFLLDSVTGKIWIALVGDTTMIFIPLEVEGLHKGATK